MDERKDETLESEDDFEALIEGASPERKKSIELLLQLNDERAALYGEALTILDESDYNVGTIRAAIQKVKDEQGPEIIRTRTNVRVFKFPVNEDDLDEGFTYRGFYVKTITSEQKVSLDRDAAEKAKAISKSGLQFDKIGKGDSEGALAFLQSDEFRDMLAQPNKLMREIVEQNTVEVMILQEDGKIKKPLAEVSYVGGMAGEGIYEITIPEPIYAQLEEDLRILLQQQGTIAKNLQMVDMLGF